MTVVCASPVCFTLLLHHFSGDQLLRSSSQASLRHAILQLRGQRGLSVSDCLAPPLLPRSGTQRARRSEGSIGETTSMRTSGTLLLADKPCSPARVRLAVQSGLSACRLLYSAAVQRSSYVGRDHLINRDLRSRPLPVHFGADLLKYSSTMGSERQWLLRPLPGVAESARMDHAH